MLQMGQDELPLRAVLQLLRRARLRIDQLRVDQAARAQVHAVLLLALAPERDADVADAHRLGDLRAPAVLEGGAEGGDRRGEPARDGRQQPPLPAEGVREPDDAVDERWAMVFATPSILVAQRTKFGVVVDRSVPGAAY
jgi:hypothetical protein